VDITDWIGERYDLTYRLGNWAARGLMPALQGVTAEMANWRPAHDQHTIAEIVAHIAYHKELVAKRLRGEPREYLQESDWQAGPPTKDGWGRVVARLEAAHQDLGAVITAIKPDQLSEPLDRSWLSPELVTRRIDLAVDVATHDIYHAGQIFVLKRLFQADLSNN
jgi:uncharacterized damage-inducible protein DinB